MIITFDDLAKVRDLHQNERVVLVGGCYDLLHVGHVAFLKRCRAYGDILVVAASSDLRVRERKGDTRPIIGEAERVNMLAELKCVDYALISPEPHADLEPPTVLIIKALKPNVFTTSDSRYHEYAQETLKYGTKVVHVPHVGMISTTDIIDRIRQK